MLSKETDVRQRIIGDQLVHPRWSSDLDDRFLSYNMQDVFAVSDRIVVMRRGRKVGELTAYKTTPDEVVSLMVGAEAVHEMGVIPKALESSEGAI